MKYSIYRFSVVLILMLSAACELRTGNDSKFHFLDRDDRVDLYFRDQLITSYLFADSLQKQVFYPVRLPSGYEFTRAYPLRKKAGESTDHLHHIGVWFSYGEVNGVDFWTSTWENYDGVNPRHGKIAHQEVGVQVTEEGNARFSTVSQWKKTSGDTLLTERSETIIAYKAGELTFDRKTTLFAREDIHFQDSKEGMYGIRVGSLLQEDPADTMKGAIYINSEGQKGADVWGQQAEWVLLKSRSEEQPASILFIDHPDNPGYPAHWMARGYGLFAVNPLGKGTFTEGKDSLNLRLKKNDSVVFKYRFVLTDSKGISREEIEAFTAEFHKN